MKRSKLLIGCYLLSIIMATVSIGVSVAWYASAAQLRIETLEIGVHADKSLMITDKSPQDYASMDAFIESFEKHEFDNLDNPPLFGKSEVDVNVFEPVTSMYSFAEDWHTEKTWLEERKTTPEFLGAYQDFGTRIPNKPSVIKSSYYSQTLYLLSKSNSYVSLDPYQSFFNGNPVALREIYDEMPSHDKDEYTAYNEKVLQKQKEEHDRLHQLNKEAVKNNKHLSDEEEIETWASKMDNLYKALRVSLLVPDEDENGKDEYNYTILDPFMETDSQGNDIETVFAGRLNTSTDEFFDTYDAGMDKDNDHYFKETFYGDIDEKTRDNAIYSASPTDKTTTISGTISKYDKSSFNAYTDSNTYALDVESSLKEDSQGNALVRAAKEHAVAMRNQGGRDADLLIPVYANTPRKIVLSIYLEGWDLDCIDSTMGAYFTSTLSFTIAREM